MVREQERNIFEGEREGEGEGEEGGVKWEAFWLMNDLRHSEVTLDLTSAMCNGHAQPPTLSSSTIYMYLCPAADTTSSSQLTTYLKASGH